MRPTLLISTAQQGDFFDFKGNRVAAEAKMFLRSEARRLGHFVATLPALDQGDGEEAMLECFSANPDDD